MKNIIHFLFNNTNIRQKIIQQKLFFSHTLLTFYKKAKLYLQFLLHISAIHA